jgi:hypothetical protein
VRGRLIFQKFRRFHLSASRLSLRGHMLRFPINRNHCRAAFRNKLLLRSFLLHGRNCGVLSELMATLEKREKENWHLTLPMKLLRQFGAIALLLISCIAPVMACMRADAQMSPQERACCRVMKNQCGAMQMPASHSCCQPSLESNQDEALAANTIVLHPFVAVADRLTTMVFGGPNPLFSRWFQYPEHSPPKSPPSAALKLRI